MNKKRLLVIISEGPTDQEFYKKVLDTIKKVNGNGNFNFDKIDYILAKGISNFARKTISIFKNRFCIPEYDDYEKVVCLCYDLDVFSFNNKPPVDRVKMKKDLYQVGADKVINILANKMIEDFFLLDIEGIKKYLKLPKKYKIPNKTGLELLKQIFRDKDRLYIKGEKVEGLVDCLNIEKILNIICKDIKPLCDELGYKCNGNKCKR